MKYKYDKVERSPKKINDYKEKKIHRESSLRMRSVVADFFAFWDKK